MESSIISKWYFFSILKLRLYRQRHTLKHQFFNWATEQNFNNHTCPPPQKLNPFLHYPILKNTFTTFATLLQTLNKKRNINFKALLLILIYSFSISPVIMFHHHNYNVVAYETATPCEKAAYYQYKIGQCTHKAHITNAVQKCPLCDNHNLTDYLHNILVFTFIKAETNSEHNSIIVNIISLSPAQTSNRGPPTV